MQLAKLISLLLAQLFCQNVEIFPSENFRYISVVNGTKSYGIIFGAADPDLDTTGTWIQYFIKVFSINLTSRSTN
jgi:hypothetical protein